MICFVFLFFFSCLLFLFFTLFFTLFDGRNVVDIIYIYFLITLFFIDNLTLQTASRKHLINSSEIECFTLTCIGNANAFFSRRGLL